MEQKVDAMRGAGGLSDFRPMTVAAPLAVILAVAGILADVATWIELNVAILYSFPLVLAAVARNRRLLWVLVVVLLGVTFSVYVVQVAAIEGTRHHALLLDRVLVGMSLLLNAVVLHAWMTSMENLVLRDRAIDEKNAALQAANQVLVLKDQEIVRQNAELESRRADAEQASMRKSQMLASLSHDLRTPIQAIMLLSELVSRTAERADMAGKIPSLARRLQSNAVSVVDFLSEMIDLASFDSGRVSVNASEFTLDDLLAEQRQWLLPLADSKGLEIRIEVPDEPLWLLTDRVKLARVIANLVGNAVKFTDAGTVTVSCGRGAGGAWVRVADTGCGIKAEHLSGIFGEYAQGDQTIQAGGGGGGWGLGLAISRRMVRLLGGDIHVASQWGVGSTFTVELPASCLRTEGGAGGS